jgi:hypothetical protein
MPAISMRRSTVLSYSVTCSSPFSQIQLTPTPRNAHIGQFLGHSFFGGQVDFKRWLIFRSITV